MNAILSYRGPADLTLIYGRPLGLGRTAVRPGVEVVVSWHTATAPVSVLVDRDTVVLEGGLHRAVVALPDGRVIYGLVQEVAESGEYFEIAAGSQAIPGGR